MKSDIIDFIDKLLIKKYKESISSNKFYLYENAKSASCRKAKITVQSKKIIYKFDKSTKGSVNDIYPFFNDLDRIKAICDYLIFYLKNDCVYCICLNMKSGNQHNNIDQTNAGFILGELILNTVKRILGNDCLYKFHYIPVLYSSIRLYKGSTNNALMKNVKFRYYVSNEEVTDECDLDSICHK
jgi:hypothetical protein